jgi:SpoVK/Ycf46/Vps4 family AAA+-type ATPase
MTDTNELDKLVEELNKLDDPDYIRKNGEITTQLQQNLIVLQIKKLAENKDLDAMSWLAQALMWGNHGIARDVLWGLKMMQEVARNGHTTSCIFLIEYHQGNFPEINSHEYPHSGAELLRYVRIGAENNDDYCLWYLYMHHAYSIAGPSSESAIECLKKLKETEFPPALFYLGRAYEQGLLDEEDSSLSEAYSKAYKCYKKGLEVLRGDKAHLYKSSIFHRRLGINSCEIEGQLSFSVGYHLYTGSGVKKDTDKGLSYIIDAASGGCIPAQEWLKNPPVKLSKEDQRKVNKTVELPLNIPKMRKRDQKIWENIDRNKESECASAELQQDEIEEAMKALNNLIGLRNVKQQVKQLINVSIANKRREDHGLPKIPLTLHCVFTGPPGTGKTTVARLYGEMLYKLGFLDKGHVVEVDRQSLVGEYVGATAIRTERVVNSAKNGVLFIDEAYSLYANTERDFGPEAVATLLKKMEDNRDSLVVIMAGYKEPMDKLIDSNEGLKSRFTNYIDFEPYSEEDLVKIFEFFCKSHMFSLTDESRELLEAIVKDAYQRSEYQRSNGRGMRTLFEKTLAKQCQRIIDQNIDTKDEMNIISPEDLFIPQECTIDNVTFLSDQS